MPRKLLAKRTATYLLYRNKGVQTHLLARAVVGHTLQRSVAHFVAPPAPLLLPSSACRLYLVTTSQVCQYDSKWKYCRCRLDVNVFYYGQQYHSTKTGRYSHKKWQAIKRSHELFQTDDTIVLKYGVQSRERCRRNMLSYCFRTCRSVSPSTNSLSSRVRVLS